MSITIPSAIGGLSKEEQSGTVRNLQIDLTKELYDAGVGPHIFIPVMLEVIGALSGSFLKRDGSPEEVRHILHLCVDRGLETGTKFPGRE